jgi:hypothetical protein
MQIGAKLTKMFTILTFQSKKFLFTPLVLTLAVIEHGYQEAVLKFRNILCVIIQSPFLGLFCRWGSARKSEGLA